MGRKKKQGLELRFYEVPQGEKALFLMGEKWVRQYGQGERILHFHNLMEVGICPRGAGELWMDEACLAYKTGSITLIPPNYPHTTVSAGEAFNAWEYIFFDPAALVQELFPENPVYQKEVVSCITRRPLLVSALVDPDLAEIVDLLMEEYKEKKSYYRQMIQRYMENLLFAILRCHGDNPSLETGLAPQNNLLQIAPGIAYMEQNYALPVKISECAKQCGMSETHYRRLFEEYSHMTPTDYLNLLRVQRACELMRRSADSMEVVAMKCGFATVSTFNRNFRKFVGTSPYRWKSSPNLYESKLLHYRITALKGW